VKDREPTKILANGALRYGVYDDAGNLLRYEYIKLEDEPTEKGDPLCKATLLSDAASMATGGSETVSNAILYTGLKKKEFSTFELIQGG